MSHASVRHPCRSLLSCSALSGCGYHTLGAATHLPPDVRTLAVPVFATRTEAYHTETVMTEAVIREFATRTRLRVTPDASARSGRGAAWDDSQGDGGAAHLQLLDAAVVQLSDHHGGLRSRSPAGTARCSTRTRTTSTASSTSPPPTCRRFSRRARRPWSGSRGSLRGSWWPMCWKGSESAGIGTQGLGQNAGRIYSGLGAAGRVFWRRMDRRIQMPGGRSDERRALGRGIHRDWAALWRRSRPRLPAKGR